MQWVVKRKWQRWRQLARWERRVLLALWWRVSLASVLVHVAGMPRLLAIANCPLGNLNLQDAELNAFVERCGELADTAARQSSKPASCLPTSLALCHLLRSHGIDAQLRIGVQRNNALLDAHAWVEHAGKPVGTVAGTYHAIL